MKRLLYILLTIIFAANYTSATERWAIVIGISKYPTQSGWRAISGAKDIGLVVPMLQRNGFPLQNIITLPNEQATKQNIKKAVYGLCEKLEKGDVVYFHFSGHGQLITDLNGDEIDKDGNPKGWDSSLIPYDAQYRYNPNGYKGENHIVDDELNGWLHCIKNAVGSSGKLLVVLDACHSGGSSRGENDDEDVVRGTSDNFTIPQPKPYINATAEDYKIDWVCISACGWAQSNYEYQGYGRLSQAISKVLSPMLSQKELKKQIKDEYLKMPHRWPQEVDIDTNKLESYIVL